MFTTSMDMEKEERQIKLTKCRKKVQNIDALMLRRCKARTLGVRETLEEK